MFIPRSIHPTSAKAARTHLTATIALGLALFLPCKMTQFFVQLPAGDTITLDLDLNTTTVAAVKATVDAHLESIWRASGVRILRSDLPFRGIILRYRNRLLAMNKVLSSCKVGEGSTLYAQWPPKSEKHERRKRYGKGWDSEPVLKRRIREDRELERAETGKKSAEKKALRKVSKKKTSRVVENITQSALETGGDAQISSGYMSDYRPDDETEGEAKEDYADAGGEGGQGLSEEVVDEGQDEQRAEGVEQAERPMGEVEQDDPFADEDDNKENREPEAPLAPVVGNLVDGYPAEEWSGFDESNSGLGLDLLEEVLEF